MVKIKSPIFDNEEVQLKANFNYDHFQKNDYTYQIIFFYSFLFHSEKIASPELHENLIHKIRFLVKKKKLLRIYETNDNLLSMLIKGLLRYMGIDSMCRLASDILVRIFKPNCFGEASENIEKEALINVTKQFFEKHPIVFHEFMDNYNKIINKIMTDYTVALADASRLYTNQPRNNVEPEETTSSTLKKLMASYTLLTDLMKILEFLLIAYPYEFFDINNLNCSRLCNFLKNLSSRILEDTYLDRFIKVVEKWLAGRGPHTFNPMALSIVGIFLNIDNNKQLPVYNDFIIKLIAASDFDLEPFYNVYERIERTEELSTQIEKFKQILDEFALLKTKKAERKMTVEEWEEKTKNENMCIICYTNEINRLLVPCKHGNIIINQRLLQ